MARARRWMIPTDEPLPRIPYAEERMAEPIVRKSPKEPKKTETKRKRPRPAPASEKSRKPQDPCIPISRDELFQLHDIADALRLLRDIASEAPELQIISVEILIKKASRCAWNLIHEELDGRWADTHPNVDLIKND